MRPAPISDLVRYTTMSDNKPVGRFQRLLSSPWVVLVGAVLLLVGLIVVEANWPGAASDTGKAFGWPLALVAMAAVFRKPLSSLCTRVLKIEYGAARIEIDKIDKRLEVVREVAVESGKANEQAPNVTQSAGTLRRDREVLREVAIRVPTAAIVESWAWLREALEEAYHTVEGSKEVVGRITTPRILTRLTSAGIVGPDEEKAIYSMFRLRNDCAHKSPSSIAVTAAQAIDYLIAADNLSRIIAERKSRLG